MKSEERGNNAHTLMETQMQSKLNVILRGGNYFT